MEKRYLWKGVSTPINSPNQGKSHLSRAENIIATVASLSGCTRIHSWVAWLGLYQDEIRKAYISKFEKLKKGEVEYG
jgi:precorrin-6B methylase 2